MILSLPTIMRPCGERNDGLTSILYRNKAN